MTRTKYAAKNTFADSFHRLLHDHFTGKINTITGYIDLIADNNGSDQEINERCLEIITSARDKAKTAVEEYLQLIKGLKSNGTVNITQIILDAVNQKIYACKSDGLFSIPDGYKPGTELTITYNHLGNDTVYPLKITITLDPRVPNLETMYSLFIGAIGNFVSNAVKAMDALKDKDEKELRIEQTYIDNTLEIKITDTGVGIDDDLKSKLFREVVQGFTKHGQLSQGIGLKGTYKYWTETLGGTISFESESDKGTTFTLILPYTPNSSPAKQ